MNPIAQKIRKARLKANMTEKQLAKKCGLASSYIIQIESGKKIISETNAEKILKVFGEKIDVDYLYNDDREEPKIKKKTVSNTASVNKSNVFDIEPNSQWEGAIANIIKNFPIYDIKTNKIVGEKQLPILSKKIDGISWDKLLLIKSSDDFAVKINIFKNSIVWVSKVDKVFDNGIYFVKIKGLNQIKRVRKLDGVYELYPDMNGNDKSLQIDYDDVKIIGKCIKVEFNL